VDVKEILRKKVCYRADSLMSLPLPPNPKHILSNLRRFSSPKVDTVNFSPAIVLRTDVTDIFI
jgi:hypothetical protein